MRDTDSFNKITKKMRDFFQDEKGFVEVPTQSRLSILAACEDPKTISKFNFDGIEYPLPQTGQMWLEYELLKNPKRKGVFCVSTSYRNEPNPVDGRHKKIFPMFEFESHGGMDSLIKMEKELLIHLGFKEPFHHQTYDGLCAKYDTPTIEIEHEEKLCKEYGNVVFLEFFPQRSQPFWNMKINENEIGTAKDKCYNKIDVIIHGQETVGSAERSCDPNEMKNNFYNISNGEYAQLLFEQFGEQRVIDELDEYLLSYDFFPRYGGGIGMTRMARAMKLEGLL